MSSSAEVIHCQGSLLILHILCLVCVTQTGFSTPCGRRNSHLPAQTPSRGRMQTLPLRKNDRLLLTLMQEVGSWELDIHT